MTTTSQCCSAADTQAAVAAAAGAVPQQVLSMWGLIITVTSAYCHDLHLAVGGQDFNVGKQIPALHTWVHTCVCEYRTWWTCVWRAVPAVLLSNFTLPLPSCSCSLSWEMIVPIASGQGHSPQVKGYIQIQPLALEESSSPESIKCLVGSLVDF